jgi:hypothetical protein
MAIQFDASKATMFRNVNFGNENAIANLNGTGGVKANGRYSLFGKFSRTDAQRADNNAVRTELLKTLGQAFGIPGMSEEGGTSWDTRSSIRRPTSRRRCTAPRTSRRTDPSSASILITYFAWKPG